LSNFLILFALLTSVQLSAKIVRGCQTWGFFAEFFWVLNYLDDCHRRNITPCVHWNEKFAYFDKNRKDTNNCWEYFFEPLSKERFEIGDEISVEKLYNNDFSCIWSYQQYIENLNLLSSNDEITLINFEPFSSPFYEVYPAKDFHLYEKVFRSKVYNLINRYVILKPKLICKINRLYNKLIKNQKVIGIHLRGGFLYNEVPEVSIDMIIDRASREYDNETLFFIATDQEPLLEKFRTKLGPRVLFYDFKRYEKSSAPTFSAQLTPEDAENLIIETFLLSKCSHMIHTISNVSTMALYLNPSMPHSLMY